MAAKKKVSRRRTSVSERTRRSSPAMTLRHLVATVKRQAAIIRELCDRQAILDCAVRFSRGVNRRDRALILSVFHDDAIDDHGFFVGDREGFANWIDRVYDNIDITQHFVTNQTVDLQGNTAHAEIYWFVANVQKGSVSVTLRGGRYVDRFERRRGEWKIAARVCLIEWNCATGDFEMPAEVLAELAKSGVATTDRSDPSYRRPLRITRRARLLQPDAKNARTQGGTS